MKFEKREPIGFFGNPIPIHLSASSSTRLARIETGNFSDKASESPSKPSHGFARAEVVGSGVITSLSRRGTFIETTDTLKTGQPIRVEFKIGSQLISVFANVTRTHEGEIGNPDAMVPGIDVIFYEVDDTTDAMISEAVEQIWMLYRP